MLHPETLVVVLAKVNVVFHEPILFWIDPDDVEPGQELMMETMVSQHGIAKPIQAGNDLLLLILPAAEQHRLVIGLDEVHGQDLSKERLAAANGPVGTTDACSRQGSEASLRSRVVSST